MNRLVVAGVAGILGLGVVGAGKAQDLPGQFRLDNPLLRSSVPTIWNTGNFSSSIGFDWTLPNTALPPARLASPQNVNVPARSSSGLPVADWAPKLDYATAEVGFLYGRSTGKYGGELKEAYIIGDVGDDKFHISVGAAYQDSSFRFPRGWR